MSTHNIYFWQEIRKLLCRYPLLSVAIIYPRYSKTEGLTKQYRCPRNVPSDQGLHHLPESCDKMMFFFFQLRFF